MDSVYEYPSREMEKVAGDVIVDPTKSFQEVKQEQQPPIDHQPQLPTFSGMTNCNITLNFNYTKKINQYVASLLLISCKRIVGLSL